MKAVNERVRSRLQRPFPSFTFIYFFPIIGDQLLNEGKSRNRGMFNNVKDECILIIFPCPVSIIYNLTFPFQVTKQRFFQKPTLHDFETAVSSLRALLEEAGVPCIGLPWLGCGRDRLSRSKVWEILHRCFRNSPIIVTVYELPDKHIM